MARLDDLMGPPPLLGDRRSNPGSRATMEELYRAAQEGRSVTFKTEGHGSIPPGEYTGHIVQAQLDEGLEYGFGSNLSVEIRLDPSAQEIEVQWLFAIDKEDDEMFRAEAVKDRSSDTVKIYVVDTETDEYLDREGNRRTRDMGSEKPIFDTMPIEIAGPVADAIHNELG